MRYNAFISYKHSELDMFVAKKVHKGLETFPVPHAVAKKTGVKKIQRVFRDQEELPIGSDLGDNIVGALRETEFLIVICSPRTKESYWVTKEIDTFIQMHGREKILAVLIEGEPDEAFPDALLTDDEGNPVEPLAADVRGSSQKEVNKKLKTEIMRLAAPLLHCGYDDLRQRHKERRMKKMMAAASAVAVLATAFGIYSAYNTTMIQQNYQAKQMNQSKYLADTSLQLFEEGDRKAAVLVAMEALPGEENDRPFVANAQYALSKALYAYDTGNVIGLDGLLKHELPIRDFCFNEDATRLLSVDSGSSAYLWDMETEELLLKISPSIEEDGYILNVEAFAITAENNVILADMQKIRALNQKGELLWEVVLEDYCMTYQFSPSAKILACVLGESVTFIDTATGNELAKMENTQEADYSITMAFNEAENKFAISHSAEKGKEQGCISLYDFNSGEIVSYETVMAQISEMNLTWDNNIIAAGTNLKDISEYETGETETGFIEKINTKTGKQSWLDSYEVKVFDMETAGIILKSRKYITSTDNTEHDEVVLTVDNCVYTWDAATGEKIVSENITNGIYAMFISKINSLGYLADSNGIIHIFDLTTGRNYTDSAIDTGKNLKDVIIRGGVIAVRGYESPNITVLKYHEGNGKEEIEAFAESIVHMDVAADESYYTVKINGAEVDRKYYFYKSKDKSCIGNIELSEEAVVFCQKFVKDSLYAIICENGTVLYYDLKNQKTEELSVNKDITYADCYVTEESNFVLFLDGRDYYVVDLSAKKVVYSGAADSHMHGAVLSEDGKKIYTYLMEEGVVVIDAETAEQKNLAKENYVIASGAEINEIMELSRDGRFLAVCCTDNVLRILDIQTMETAAEFSFAGRYNCFLHFSKDGSTLILQGDDYYLKMYSMEEQKFLYIAAGQNNSVEEVIENDKTDVIVIKTIEEMVIFERATAGKIAEIESGLSYFPEQKKIYCSKGNVLYEFPYKSLETLMKEAKEQFGEETLTEMEKIQYHVD